MRTTEHRGITLTELLIAIAVLTLVMALLGFPLLSAFNYIQKATARSEARRAGAKAAQQLARELNVAMYVFELPPDGSWVSFLQGAQPDEEQSRGMAMDYGNRATVVRYMRILDFPWVWESSAWKLLAPNYMAYTASADATSIYSARHAPYYAGTTEPNPYIVARYEQSMPWSGSDSVWGSATSYALYGEWPLDNYTGGRQERWRRLRNNLIAITPYGDQWDVPNFKVIPRRISTEALTPLTDAQGRKDGTVFLTRYPLIAGRSRDIDDIDAALVESAYGNYWKEPANIAAEFPLYPKGVNPFGYQVRVFGATGGLVYGTQFSADGTVSYTYRRHFMDWPPVDRPDWDPALWTRDDIARQRLEGKVVFAQPMAAASLDIAAVGGIPTTSLPIPPSPSWQANSALTYVTYVPDQVTLRNGAAALSFKLADSAAGFARVDARHGKFYLPNRGARDRASRIVQFNPPAGTSMPDGAWAVVYPGTNASSKLVYKICDLQPEDTVVATYSTKAALDVALTVSRQDTAARDPEKSRQDYTTNMRIDARNATDRARRSQ